MQPSPPPPPRAPPTFTPTRPPSPPPRPPPPRRGAADLHAHVADLARRAPPDPRLAVEHDPAADAGPPKDAQQRGVRLRGAELELGVDRDLHVVAERQRRAELALERLAHVEGAGPA